jgi:hypothetical protein
MKVVQDNSCRQGVVAFVGVGERKRDSGAR